jgi:hypothetical protein
MRKSLFPYVLWLNRIPYVSHVNIQAREIALNSRVQELSFIGLGNGVPLKVWSFVYTRLSCPRCTCKMVCLVAYEATTAKYGNSF